MADEEAATTAYYFAGLHADTLYQGEGEDAKCIPIGPGEPIQLSQEDVENPANAHLFESGALLAVPETEPEPEAEATEEEAPATTGKTKATTAKK